MVVSYLKNKPRLIVMGSENPNSCNCAAACCVAGWAAVAVVGPSLAGDENTPLGSDGDALPLIGIGAVASLLVLGLLALRRRSAQPEPSLPGEPALGGPSS